MSQATAKEFFDTEINAGVTPENPDNTYRLDFII